MKSSIFGFIVIATTATFLHSEDFFLPGRAELSALWDNAPQLSAAEIDARNNAFFQMRALAWSDPDQFAQDFTDEEVTQIVEEYREGVYSNQNFKTNSGLAMVSTASRLYIHGNQSLTIGEFVDLRSTFLNSHSFLDPDRFQEAPASASSSRRVEIVTNTAVSEETYSINGVERDSSDWGSSIQSSVGGFDVTFQGEDFVIENGGPTPVFNTSNPSERSTTDGFYVTVTNTGAGIVSQVRYYPPQDLVGQQLTEEIANAIIEGYDNPGPIRVTNRASFIAVVSNSNAGPSTGINGQTGGGGTLRSTTVSIGGPLFSVTPELRLVLK